MLTWAASMRELLTRFLQNLWILCPKHHSLQCALFAFYNLKSVPLVSSSFFFSCIHVGTINASLISRKKFTALHALFYVSRYLFYCTARVINGQEIKYDFYSSRAQYDCNRFVIILFRKQGLKRSNKIVRDGSS